MIKLAPYQEEAVNWLFDNRRTILGDAPGVGKSFPALEASRQIPDWAPGNRSLLVAPAYLLGQWQGYVSEYLNLPSERVAPLCGTPKQRQQAIDSNAEWLLCSYAMLASTKRKNKKKHSYPKLTETPYRCVIFDEAHRMRGRKSKCTQWAGKLQSDYHWLLTGTPLIGNGGSIWSLLAHVDKASFSSYWKFVEKWCHVEHTPWSIKPGKIKDKEAFGRYISKWMLRRTLEDVGIDLEKPIFYDIVVDPEPWQKKMHKQIKKDYIVEYESGEQKFLTGAGGMVVALRELTGAPEIKNAHKNCPKIRGLKGILEEYPNEPTIVFTWYKKARDLVAQACDSLRPTLCVADLSKRNQIIEEWKKTNNGVLVTTLGALSEGANLQHAHNIVFYEQDWLETTQQQAIARAVRRGQKRAVKVFFIKTKKTIDMHIAKICKKRREDIHKALLELFYEEDA